jgi:hypothetical protein
MDGVMTGQATGFGASIPNLGRDRHHQETLVSHSFIKKQIFHIFRHSFARAMPGLWVAHILRKGCGVPFF